MIEEYLKIEDQLIVVFLFGHLVEGGDQILGIESLGGEGDQSNCTVVGEVYEDVVLAGGLEDLLSLSCCGVSLQNCQEVGGGDLGLGVINFDASIDINSGFGIGGFVEDLALEGVADALCDVIVGEGNDVVFGDAILFDLLIGVEDVGLMPVVRVGVGASHKYGPVGTDCHTHEQTEE